MSTKRKGETARRDDSCLSLMQNLMAPPDEYGEVAFYWFVGDKLTKKRLRYQLNKLKGRHVCGLQINYCHTDKGGYFFGLPYQSDPPLFSEQWWSLFGWLLRKCERLGICLSLSDYTLASAGQGYFMDDILSERPDLNGKLLHYEEVFVRNGDAVPSPSRGETVSCMFFPADGTAPVAVRPGDRGVGNGVIRTVSCVKKDRSLDPMHPDAGKSVIRHFFREFERRFPGKCGTALNFFFSDELNFNISGNLWNDFFAEEFIGRKGYDVRPELAALFCDIGDRTPKIRLDYYDVIVQLEEENYFSPVYEWHRERNMIYGCDHGGRGRLLTEFGDYFRTQKYNQGPGNDQPGLQSDLIKDKVSASIAHLYERPRVWLEGFYGSGWQTSSGDVADAVFRNFGQGSNLLTLHGLYYTTHGGFWEWAPPCNHFRMPYWKHMGKLLFETKQLSYLLSRGKHVCDIAVFYPVASVEAGTDADLTVNTAFSVAEELYANGYDFDFIDFESLDRATVGNGKFSVSGENFSLIVLPAMTALRFSNAEKLLSLAKAGVRVLFVGRYPDCSDRAGRNDAVLSSLFDEIGKNGALFQEKFCISLLKTILVPDLERSGNGRFFFLHRRVPDADFYYLYGCAKGEIVHLRVHGIVELFDVANNKFYSLDPISSDETGISVKLPLEATNVTVLFVRSGTSVFPKYPERENERIDLDGEWKFRICPVLDNRFGDFSLPATRRRIPPQIRTISRADGEKAGESVKIGSAEMFLRYGPYKTADRLTELQILNGRATDVPTAVSLSMRYGAEGDPGHQGYHGLKGNVSDEFLVFGKPRQTMTETLYDPDERGSVYYFCTYFSLRRRQKIYFLTGSVTPDVIWVDGMEIHGDCGWFGKGIHRVVFRIDGNGRTYFILSRVPKNKLRPPRALSMTWYDNPDILPFDIRGEAFQKPEAVGNNPAADGASFKNGTVSDEKETGETFFFYTPPGTKSFRFRSGLPLKISSSAPLYVRTFGNRVKVTFARRQNHPQKISVFAGRRFGAYGGNIFKTYIDCDCSSGKVQTGAWEDIPGMEFYSGAAVYEKTFRIEENPSDLRATLLISELSSSAEVFVNGVSAGIKCYPPFAFDLTGLLKRGENRLKIEVFNTLSNHYLTIPTRYNRKIRSGIFGTVSLLLSQKR